MTRKKPLIFRKLKDVRSDWREDSTVSLKFDIFLLFLFLKFIWILLLKICIYQKECKKENKPQKIFNTRKYFVNGLFRHTSQNVEMQIALVLKISGGEYDSLLC